MLRMETRPRDRSALDLEEDPVWPLMSRASWDATGAATTTRTSLPGQFAQMRVGEPSVGA